MKPSASRATKPFVGHRPFAVARALALAATLALAGCGADAVEEVIVIPEPFVVPTPPARPGSVEEIFPDVGRRGLVLNNCASCHAVACLALGQRTPEQWASVEATHRYAVPGMSVEDLGKAFDYLKRHFNDSMPEPVVPSEWLNGDCVPANPAATTP